MSLQPLAGLDLFNYLLDYRVLVCRSCRTGVAPTHLKTHLWTKHRQHFRTQAALGEWIQQQLLNTLPSPPLDPFVEDIQLPPFRAKPQPALQVSYGYGCRHCTFVCKDLDTSSRHFARDHAPFRRQRGRPRQERDKGYFQDGTPWERAWYQRFFRAAVPKNSCFRVETPQPISQSADRSIWPYEADPASYIATEVLSQLTCLEAEHAAQQSIVTASAAKSQVSP